MKTMAGKALFSIMVSLWMMLVMLSISFKWPINKNLLEKESLKMMNFLETSIRVKTTSKIHSMNAIAKKILNNLLEYVQKYTKLTIL